MENALCDVHNHEIRRITIIGLVINIVLSAVKLFAGFAGNSRAVIADAIHSISDCTTDVAVIVGSHYWSRPPDDTHQHGHRRIETIVTFFIGIVLMAAGISVGWVAVSTINEQHLSPPGWIAVIAAALSIIFKEALYRWTVNAGARLKSPSLAANAWHHRSDALSSIPTMLAVIGAIVIPDWSILDHIGASIVSVFIIQAAIKIIWPGLIEFIDAAAPKTVCDQILECCLKHDKVKQVHKLRTRYVGLGIHVDLHIEVDQDLSILEGHNISGQVKEMLFKEVCDIADILIHIEPYLNP